MAKRGTTKYNSNKQEKKVASQFDGKTVMASGALWQAKADVRSDKYLIECKTTSKDYYPLTSKVWEKISHEAIHDNMRVPILAVDLMDGKESYAVIDEWFLDELLTSYNGRFDPSEYNLYSSANKSLRVHSLNKDSYCELYHILRDSETKGCRYNKLALLRLSDLLTMIKEEKE
jgi:hypothetical protein